ncbi:MAG: hypothetical protein M1531_10070 [Chloroflexi bacterium]|nr:hypothetical protein [Chloroflexota bacterium]
MEITAGVGEAAGATAEGVGDTAPETMGGVGEMAGVGLPPGGEAGAHPVCADKMTATARNAETARCLTTPTLHSMVQYLFS